MVVRVGFEVHHVAYHCNRLANRKTGEEMYRVFVNGRFVKPPVRLEDEALVADFKARFSQQGT